MLNFGRSDRAADAKTALKPALYEPPGSTPRPAAGNVARPAATVPTSAREVPVAPPPVAAGEAPKQEIGQTPDRKSEPAGSKLSVGINIKLKGVEISDCDVLIIEGHVEATVHSKTMQIAKPGTLKGTALIDVAEIHGDFSGELTARTRLIVHGTGRVSGTIRYGKLVVAEGGELSGDVKRLEGADEQAQPGRVPASGPQVPLGSTGERASR